MYIATVVMEITMHEKIRFDVRKFYTYLIRMYLSAFETLRTNLTTTAVYVCTCYNNMCVETLCMYAHALRNCIKSTVSQQEFYQLCITIKGRMTCKNFFLLSR